MSRRHKALKTTLSRAQVRELVDRGRVDIGLGVALSKSRNRYHIYRRDGRHVDTYSTLVDVLTAVRLCLVPL